MACGRVSRRDFLRTTAGTALAGRAILLEPRGLAALPRPVPPSDRVRFGIIGVGMQGSGLLRTSIRLPGVECAAACDLYDGRIELAKQIVQRPIPTTKRYHELLENKEIDCIIAAVPDHWHKQIVVACCNAGKDVYCEKPMTHQVAEGFEIIVAEKKNNRIVQIGSQRRSSIVYQKAKELLASGAVGQVCLVEASMGRNDPCGAWQYEVPPDLSPQTLDWATWLGTAPKIPFNKMHFTRWRCWRAYGEGIPGDLYVHLLTGIHYVAGIDAPPARASTVGGLYRWKDGRDVPDCISTHYEYPKFDAALRVTLNTGMPEVTRFMGDKGLMEIRGGRVTVTPQDGLDSEPCTQGWPKGLRDEFGLEWHRKHDLPVGAAQTVESVTYAPPPHYNEDEEHLWNFFQSVRTRQPSVEDGTFGNNTAIACHMANYAYEKRVIARWDGALKRIRP